jgi:hypothetical protein
MAKPEPFSKLTLAYKKQQPDKDIVDIGIRTDKPLLHLLLTCM